MYKQISGLVLLFLLIPYMCNAEEFKATGNIEVHFSPKGAATQTLVKEINTAKREILVQAYLFASKPIKTALSEARKRGVRIEAVLDNSQSQDTKYLLEVISQTGIPVYIDKEHSIAHNKVIVIDRSTLIVGSIDFSKAEENNVENMLILKGDKLLVDKYINYFEEHKGHSVGYGGKQE
jgi:phosphatidylserine/phosphatidylglycerophosphate/cardiolipin synthase-like enzyme